MTIAIDAMGGDHGPKVVVPAAQQTLGHHPNLSLILVGDEAVIQAILAQLPSPANDRITIRHTTEQVAMDELPSVALRGKKNSSMRVAINLVKEGLASACVSAGNTGALMATARYVLKTHDGVNRPAILARLPTLDPQREVRILDLGASIDATADHLFEFAVMGSVLTKAVDNIERPRIGLLNIGVEEMKGNEQIKEAAARLNACPDINYIGYVEGNDLFNNTVDVIVCDGFVGNVSLKILEGSAKLFSHYIKSSFKKSLYSKIVGLFAKPVLGHMKETLDPNRHNGASLIGLRHIVIKSHGSADSFAFRCAIEEAITEVEKKVPEKIQAHITKLLSEEPTQ